MKRVLYVGYIMWSRVWLPRYWVSRDATVSRYWPCFVVSFCRSCLKHSCQEKTQLGDIMFSDPSVCPLSVRPSVRHPSIIVYFAWRSISLLSETCDTYSPCEWTLLKSFSGSEVKGQGDLNLWSADLEISRHIKRHVIKVYTKFDQNWAIPVYWQFCEFLHKLCHAVTLTFDFLTLHLFICISGVMCLNSVQNSSEIE